MNDPKELAKLEYLQSVIDRGGGMITCGQGLGVFVAPCQTAAEVDALGYDKRCPKGWTLIAHGEATLERLLAVYEQAKQGRKAWPKMEAA